MKEISDYEYADSKEGILNRDERIASLESDLKFYVHLSLGFLTGIFVLVVIGLFLLVRNLDNDRKINFLMKDAISKNVGYYNSTNGLFELKDLRQ